MRAILNRAQLKGSRLDAECYKCRNIWETATDKDRMLHSANFCYGSYDSLTDEKVERCQNCKAHVDYAEEWFQEASGYRRECYTDGKSGKTKSGTPEPD